MFLVGQNMQALQTLANTPSLLMTFTDSRGIYDQVCLMNLVQSLRQSIPPAPAPENVSVGVFGHGPMPTPLYSGRGGTTSRMSGICGPASGSTTQLFTSNTGSDLWKSEGVDVIEMIHITIF